LVTTGAAVAFSTSEPQSTQFVAAFAVSADPKHELVFLSLRDLQAPFRNMVLQTANHAIAELRQRDPAFVENPQDPFGQHLYHHLLQRALLEWMAATYNSSWKVERLEFSIPLGRVTQQGPAEGTQGESNQTMSLAELNKLLTGNKFADIPLGPHPFKQIVLPPNTKISVQAPTTGVAISVWEIRFANPFCSVVLRAKENGGSRGLGKYREFESWVWWRRELESGVAQRPYRPAPPIQWSDDPAAFVSYVISATATFSTWRAGHPEMPQYKHWAEQLLTLLRKDWDEESMLKRIKDQIADDRLME